MVLLLNKAFITCFYHQSDGNTLKAFSINLIQINTSEKIRKFIPTEKSPFSIDGKSACFGTDIDPEPFLPAEWRRTNLSQSQVILPLN